MSKAKGLSLLDGNIYSVPKKFLERSRTAATSHFSLPYSSSLSKTYHHRLAFPPPPPIFGRIAFLPSNRRPHPSPPPIGRRWFAATTSPRGRHATHLVASREALLPWGARCWVVPAPHLIGSRDDGGSSMWWTMTRTSSPTSDWTFHWASKQATKAATGTRGWMLGAP